MFSEVDNGAGNNLEIVIDRILVSTRDLKKKLETIKEMNSDDNVDNRLDQLKDMRKIKNLERENDELRQALEDHQYGLEFIMSKYRSQVVDLIKLNKIETNKSPTDTLYLKRESSMD